MVCEYWRTAGKAQCENGARLEKMSAHEKDLSVENVYVGRDY